MAIKIKSSIDNNIKDISGVYIKINTVVKPIKYIYQKIGDNIVMLWSSVRDALSAFGAGFWQNDKPWSNNDAWKNE